MDREECEKAVQTALKNNHRVTTLYNKINQILMQSHDDTAAKTLRIICKECGENGAVGSARAYFAAPPPTIFICENRMKSQNEVREALIHELVHAYDYTVRNMDFRKPDILACSEIRSAREAECFEKLSAFQHFWGLKSLKPWLDERCARRTAVKATSAMFPDIAKEQVEKVFDTCYSDDAPFQE